jgi:hypothetical protein
MIIFFHINIKIVLVFYFGGRTDFFLPLAFLEDLPLDFVELLDLLAEDFVDPPPDFFTEEDFPPFLGFWSWAGAPPPLGAEGGATAGGGGGGLEMVRVATCRPW